MQLRTIFLPEAPERYSREWGERAMSEITNHLQKCLRTEGSNDRLPLGSINSRETGTLTFANSAIGSDKPLRLKDASIDDTVISSTGKITVFYNGTSDMGMVFRPAINTTTAVSFRNASNTPVGSITVGASAVAFNTTSDHRLKSSFAEIENPEQRVLQLRPKSYVFLSEPDKRVEGFVAHELAEVLPDAVHGEMDAVDDFGEPIYQSVNLSAVVPVLVSALQKALLRIEALEAKSSK